jgi:rhodanese-related sulfurtransferase
MIHIQRVLLFVVGLALILTSCRADLRGLQTLDVAELASWRTTRSDFAICDANNAETRERYGVIPGATLLSSYRDYELATELGTDLDRSVVFYCHSERCGAAGDAARRAIAAGYRDVWVLAPGITGWSDAGHPVDAPASAEEPS